MLQRGELITLAGLVITVIGILWSKASLEGSTKTKLDAHDGRILRIEDEQTRQWESIGQQGQDIARIEGQLNTKAKGKHV